MPKPYPLQLVIRVLKNKGFFFISQSGSHAKYRKTGSSVLTVIIPIHGKEIQHGTFKSILRQANLKAEDFKK
jgi:predicted RNA binding protein YcfA (HicA-like mRNA interferase family)